MVSKQDRMRELQTEIQEYADDATIPTTVRAHLQRAAHSVTDALQSIEDRAEEWSGITAITNKILRR